MEDQKNIMEEFKAADERFDRIENELRTSVVQTKKKVFMKLSDVDPEDAAWFKDFCDKNTDRKQFLGIKVIRAIMERMDPLVIDVMGQITDLQRRVSVIELNFLTGNKITEEEKKEIILPKTQGKKRAE
jgi:hypothetical protein